MNTHPQGAHNDIEGPFLFVGGVAHGAHRSVNRSRDDWTIPVVEPSPRGAGHADVVTRPEIYRKRVRAVGPTRTTYMVLAGLSDEDATALLQELGEA